MTRPAPPAVTLAAIRTHLRDHGSAEHAAGVQWFFKEEVRSWGWYTEPLRRYGRVLHAHMAGNQARMLAVATALFRSPVLEEKTLAVFLAQRSLGRFDEPEFTRLEAWLDRVASWADHDALAMFLLGPLLVTRPARVRRVRVWARSRDRWHRRAAAVALIHGVRRGLFYAEADHIVTRLRRDNDDMVQKGLGWLLREWCKHDRAAALPVVMRIRRETSRLVLRTACETLPPADRARVLAR